MNYADYCLYPCQAAWPSCSSTGLCAETWPSSRAHCEKAGPGSGLEVMSVGWTNRDVRQHTSAGTKSKGFSTAPAGKQAAPAEAPASVCTRRAPFTTAPRSGSCLSALAPSQSSRGPRVQGDVLRAPATALCSLSRLVSGTRHEMPAVTTNRPAYKTASLVRVPR